MTKRYLRFSDLKRMGVVGNWQTLNRWIEKEGFPPGIKVGNTRLWLESEIDAWLASHRIAAQ
jgi:predicted DNA-binding transcriptional regulator AlpA